MKYQVITQEDGHEPTVQVWSDCYCVAINAAYKEILCFAENRYFIFEDDNHEGIIQAKEQLLKTGYATFEHIKVAVVLTDFNEVKEQTLMACGKSETCNWADEIDVIYSLEFLARMAYARNVIRQYPALRCVKIEVPYQYVQPKTYEKLESEETIGLSEIEVYDTTAYFRICSSYDFDYYAEYEIMEYASSENS